MASSRAVGHDMAQVLPTSRRAWVFEPHLLGLNLRLLVILLCASTLGFDATMMNGLQALTTWREYFNEPKPALLGTINAVFSIGKILFALPSGWVADRFGRKGCLVFGICILVVGAVLQAAAQNLAMFIAARFILGIGSEFGSVPAPVLITELAYPPHRAKVSGLYQTVFYVGAIGASWSTFASFHQLDSTWSWRIPSLLQGFFPLIQLLFIWSVPESPRWLVSRGRTDEARAILTRWHAGGNQNSPLIDYEMSEMLEHLNAESEVSGLGWKALWATKADRRRTAVACFMPFLSQWTGTGLVTYYLALVLDTVGVTDSFTQTLINGILQIFNLGSAILGSLLVDRIGRRPLLLFSCIGMFWSFITFTACSGAFDTTGLPALGITVVVFIFVYFFHYAVGVTPLTFAYPAEITPFHARQKTLAVNYFLHGVLIMFNSFVNPIALDSIGWRYYIVYCILIGVAAVVVFLFFPETRGLPLEQIADVFEGPVIVWKRTSSSTITDNDAGLEGKKETVEMIEKVEE
ncbi:general substrate transporter [Aspergillus karnatakaensis]|uniref:general substrate transporter n=1 Tax=Aspergillus karnatakaensis TaxID=1810916 RepID=UPI003CCD58BB